MKYFAAVIYYPLTWICIFSVTVSLWIADNIIDPLNDKYKFN